MQTPTQPTLALISLREARELAAQRCLSSPLAGERVIEWLADENDPVRWQYEEIKNNSGVSTETVLKKFWRPGGLSVIWEESSVARKVEQPPVRAHGGVAPGGIAWASHPIRPTQPSSQLGHNFVIYGIRLMREDVERRLAGSASVAVRLISGQTWFARALKDHPRQTGESISAYTKRLSELMQGAPVTKVWPPETMRRRYHAKITKDAKEKEERKAAQKKR